MATPTQFKCCISRDGGSKEAKLPLPSTLKPSKMRNRLNDLLKTLERDWYEGKLTQHDHFGAIVFIGDALNQVPEDFTIADRRQFMASCFGHFMLMHRRMKFSDAVIHRLLLRELYHNGPTDEMRFLLGNHLVMLSMVGFCLITGLRFRVISDTSLYAAVENGIHHHYFPRADKVLFEELRVALTLGELQEA
ncbi:hypothetical protein Ddye_018111 [Dipteronia dyeriana]|uniref:Uncharacterized protein n=1 Tax=Dipteronia dyeriana TaxID=168575 RepID=A0AAD9UAN1_9ROSI|nr:hypothetical protein Ddye_018111 [Dipteronia dyeriana]